MSRFVLTRAVAATPTNGQPKMFPVGTTFADSSGNAVGGDQVIPSLANTVSTKWAAPLDAAGQTALGGVPIVTAPGNAGYVAPLCAGIDSISP
jgi:hypothetical protein